MEDLVLFIKLALRLIILNVCSVFGLSCGPEGTVLEYGVFWPW